MRRCAMRIHPRRRTIPLRPVLRTGATSASGTARRMRTIRCSMARGRVWYTARVRGPNNPAFCKRGSNHPSAKVFPLDRSGRQLAVYEPDYETVQVRRHLLGTHHLQFAADANNTLWTSGGGQVVGWLDSRKFDDTGDAAAGARLVAIRARHQRQRPAATGGWNRISQWMPSSTSASPAVSTP